MVYTNILWCNKHTGGSNVSLCNNHVLSWLDVNSCNNFGLWIFMIAQNTHTHTRFTALFPGLPGWAGTRKIKPIWILLKQEIVSGSGISWTICKSAPRSRQITMPATHHSVFYRPDALPAAQPTASKHWRQSKALTVLNTQQQYNHNCHHCVTSTLLGSAIIMCLCLSINWHI